MKCALIAIGRTRPFDQPLDKNLVGGVRMAAKLPLLCPIWPPFTMSAAKRRQTQLRDAATSLISELMQQQQQHHFGDGARKERIPLLEWVVKEMVQHMQQSTGDTPTRNVVLELIASKNLVLLPSVYIWLNERLRRIKVRTVVGQAGPGEKKFDQKRGISFLDIRSPSQIFHPVDRTAGAGLIASAGYLLHHKGHVLQYPDLPCVAFRCSSTHSVPAGAGQGPLPEHYITFPLECCWVDEADLHKVTGDDQWEVQQVQGPDGDTHQGRMPQWIANIITNHNGQAGAAAASAAAASSAAVADGSTFPPSSGAAVVHQAASQAAPSAAMPAAHVPAGRPQAAAADFAAQQPDSPAVLDKRASGLISPPGAPQAAGKVPLAAAASLAGVSSLPVDAAGLVPALVAALNRTHIMPQQILPCAVGAATATRAHTAVEQQQQQQLLTLLQELLQQQLQQLAGCSTGQSSAAHSAAAATLVESMQLPPAPTAAVHAATTALPPQPAAPPGHSPAAAAAVGSSQHAGSQPQPQHAEQPPALAAATAAAPACSSSSSGSSQSRNKNRIPLLDLVVDEVTQYLTAHSGQGVPPHEVVTELLSTHNLVLFPYLFIWLSNKLRRMRVRTVLGAGGNQNKVCDQTRGISFLDIRCPSEVSHPDRRAGANAETTTTCAAYLTSMQQELRYPPLPCVNIRHYKGPAGAAAAGAPVGPDDYISFPLECCWVDPSNLQQVTGDADWPFCEVADPEGDKYQGQMPHWVADRISQHNMRAAGGAVKPHTSAQAGQQQAKAAAAAAAAGTLNTSCCTHAQGQPAAAVNACLTPTEAVPAAAAQGGWSRVVSTPAPAPPAPAPAQAAPAPAPAQAAAAAAAAAPRPSSSHAGLFGAGPSGPQDLAGLLVLIESHSRSSSDSKGAGVSSGATHGCGLTAPHAAIDNGLRTWLKCLYPTNEEQSAMRVTTEAVRGALEIAAQGELWSAQVRAVGSFAKKTLLRGSHDLDMLVELTCDARDSGHFKKCRDECFAAIYTMLCRPSHEEQQQGSFKAGWSCVCHVPHWLRLSHPHGSTTLQLDVKVCQSLREIEPEQLLQHMILRAQHKHHGLVAATPSQVLGSAGAPEAVVKSLASPDEPNIHRATLLTPLSTKLITGFEQQCSQCYDIKVSGLTNNVIRMVKAWSKFGLPAALKYAADASSSSSHSQSGAAAAAATQAAQQSAEASCSDYVKQPPGFIWEIFVLYVLQQNLQQNLLQDNNPLLNGNREINLFMAVLEAASRLLRPSSTEVIVLYRPFSLYTREECDLSKELWGPASPLFRPYIISPVDPSYNCTKHSVFKQWEAVADAAGQLYHQMQGVLEGPAGMLAERGCSSAGEAAVTTDAWQQLLSSSTLGPAVQAFAAP